MSTRPRRRALGEEGVTLVELILYSMITMLVLSGLTMIFINMWNAQSDVETVTHSTARGQQVGAQIERAVRNAEAVQVSDAGRTLRVHTTLGGGLACQAWSVDDGTLYIDSGTGPLAASGSWGDWAEWGRDLVNVPGTEFFAGDASGLSYAFRFTTTGAPVDIAGEAHARSSTGGTAPCW